MEENPYQKIIDELTPPRSSFGFRRGKVVSAAPLTVEVSGTRQRGNLLINEALAGGHNRTVSFSGTGSVGEADGAAALVGTVTAGYGLSEGDDVLLLSEDDQSFTILCKVVKA